MKKTLIVLLIVLAFSAITRFYRLSLPKIYVFDEVYHAVTAKLYARNDPSGYEWWHPAPEPNTAIEWLHPPMAKLTQAVGITLFGENSFGWRVSSAVFGVAVVAMTYVLALQLMKVQWIGVLSAFFVSVDGLLLAQSRIAMNDIHVTFFILVALYFYSKWKEHRSLKYFVFSGLLSGLAASTKWSGIFTIGIFVADQIFEYIRKEKLPSIQFVAQTVWIWIALPAVVYLLSFSQFWLQGHTWGQFVELHRQIWHYQVNLKATHTYQSGPFQWIFDIRPVWMYVDHSIPGKVANIYNIGNPVVFIVGLAALLFIFYRLAKKWNDNHVLLLIAYLSVWLPWAFSPRIMFFYHYAPAVPLLGIALAYVTVNAIKSRSNVRKSIGCLTIALSLLWFVTFYPNLTGIPVPTNFAEAVYFAIPTWR